MKVADLIKQLSELNPDEEIFALVYNKEMFPDPDGLALSTDAWNKVVDTFHRHYDDSELWSAISSECIDESECNS